MMKGLAGAEAFVDRRAAVAEPHARRRRRRIGGRRTAVARAVKLDIRVELHERVRAVATVRGARRIAANAPVQISAAKATVSQATARYQAGLANIQEVAEAQRLLTQAEIDDALARLGVWRGLLGVARAAGNLQPFLSEASR